WRKQKKETWRKNLSVDYLWPVRMLCQSYCVPKQFASTTRHLSICKLWRLICIIFPMFLKTGCLVMGFGIFII
ncbi:hypothetical protein M513_09135, partial [Trichuris suis]